MVAAALSNPHVIPEKFNRNQYWATCYFYLNKNPELTVNGLRQIGSKNKDHLAQTCRESVFEDVKREMQLDRVLNGSKELEIDSALENAAAEEGKPRALAVALNGAGLHKPPAEPRPNNEQFREHVKDWIAANLEAGYSEFKAVFPENFINLSFYEARKREIKGKELAQKIALEGVDNMAKDGKRDARLGRINMNTDTGKVKAYLLSVPPSIRADMNPKEYAHKTGHKITDSTFHNAKFQLKKTHGNAPAQAQPSFTPPPASFAAPAPSSNGAHIGGQTMRVMAEINLAPYGHQSALVKKIALDVAKALMGDGVRVVMLADPPLLEIRLTQ